MSAFRPEADIKLILVKRSAIDPKRTFRVLWNMSDNLGSAAATSMEAPEHIDRMLQLIREVWPKSPNGVCFRENER